MGIKEELVVENPPPNFNEDSKLNVNCCVPQCGISEKLDTEIIHVLGVTEATGTSWFMSMSEIVETAPSTSDSDSDCQYSISTTCCVPSAHSEKNLSEISEPAVRSRKVANSGVGDMAATEASMTSVETSLRNISSSGPVVSNDDQSDTSGAPAWRTASPMNTAAVASTSSAVHKTAGSDAKRVWDRRNICPYCLVGQSKLSRHLERSHKTEADVVKAFVYPVGSAERKDALKLLQNKGNYYHNMDVLRKGGTLFPSRRPCAQTRVEEFLPCDKCFGFFKRQLLWRHKLKCCSDTRDAQRVSRSMLPTPSGASQSLRENVLDQMSLDSIAIACKTDELILQFGSRLHAKVGGDKLSVPYVSGKMRELGRLLIVLKETNGSLKLEDFLCPQYFSLVTQSVRQLCKFDANTRPTLALKLGHSLRKCCNLLKGAYIEIDRSFAHIDEFVELLKVRWADEVSSQALPTCLNVNESKSDKSE